MQTGTILAASPWALGLEEKLMPQYLKELGYSTHAIGKVNTCENCLHTIIQTRLLFFGFSEFVCF